MRSSPSNPNRSSPLSRRSLPGEGLGEGPRRKTALPAHRGGGPSSVPVGAYSFQMRLAYSFTDRSLLKNPQRATFRIALRVQAC